MSVKSKWMFIVITFYFFILLEFFNIIDQINIIWAEIWGGVLPSLRNQVAILGLPIRKMRRTFKLLSVVPAGPPGKLSLQGAQEEVPGAHVGLPLPNQAKSHPADNGTWRSRTDSCQREKLVSQKRHKFQNLQRKTAKEEGGGCVGGDREFPSPLPPSIPKEPDC